MTIRVLHPITQAMLIEGAKVLEQYEDFGSAKHLIVGAILNAALSVSPSDKRTIETQTLTSVLGPDMKQGEPIWVEVMERPRKRKAKAKK